MSRPAGPLSQWAVFTRYRGRHQPGRHHADLTAGQAVESMGWIGEEVSLDPFLAGADAINARKHVCQQFAPQK